MNNINQILMKLASSGKADFVDEIVSVRIESWLPLWTVPFLMVAIALGVFVLYMRENYISRSKRISLAVIRTLAYWFLLFILAAPSLRIDGEGIPPGRIVTVVDNSLSMTIKDAPLDVSRSEFALKQAKILSEVPDDVRDIELGAYLGGKVFEKIEYSEKDPFWGTGKEIAPDGESTALSLMLSKAMESNGLSACHGIVLLTDGADNASGNLNNVIAELKKKHIPVYTMGIGTDKYRDIAIRTIELDNILFVNEKYKANINISQAGFTAEKIKFKASIAGEDITPGNGEYELKQDGENVIELEFTPALTGVFELKVEVEPLPGEATSENNTFIKNFRVIDQKIRILLAFGAPSWEYRYLAGAFSRDHRVTFKTFFLESDSRRTDVLADGEAEYIKELPKTAEDLNKNFDVIIISGLDMTSVDPLFTEAVRKFVDEYSGGLVISSDAYYIPYTLKGSVLEELLPVTVPRGSGRTYADEIDRPATEELHFVMTGEGADNELMQFSGDRAENIEIWKKMPPVYRVYSEGRLKPGAVSVLAAFRNERRQTYPVIMLSSYGRGTVLFMGFDSTWRWRREFGNRFFRDFWCKAVQFAGLPHLLSESVQSVIYVSDENSRAGESLGITSRVLDNNFEPVEKEIITLKVRDPEGTESEITQSPIEGRSGLYRTDFVPKLSGDYYLSLPVEYGAKEIHLRVLGNKREFVNCSLNQEILERISRESGGRTFTVDETKDIIREIAAARVKDAVTHSFTLWDSFFMLILVIAFFCVEWIMRKLWSLD